MANFSAWILPVIVIFIILHGLAHGVKVFDCFLEGAKTGFDTFRSLLAPLVGLVMAVGMLRESGGLAVLMGLMEPLSRITGLPREVMPLTHPQPTLRQRISDDVPADFAQLRPGFLCGQGRKRDDGLVRNHFLCGYGILWRGGREKNAAYDPRGPLC